MSTLLYKSKDVLADSLHLPDKMVVFQECMHQFNASHNTVGFAKKCRHLLAQLLRLLYHGEVFPSLESTALFFSTSKLFQHKDPALRQIVYLAIKELAATSDDILMVTASIMKDIQLGNPVYKPNAIRTLAKVLDPTTVQSVERLFKSAIVDRNPIIASAALTSSYGLLHKSKEVVKHFANEVSEAIQPNKVFPSTQFSLHEFYGHNTSMLPPTSFMYQYHALGLLYQLRNHDKMALVKLITSLGDGNTLKNSLLIIQLIRYTNKVLMDDEALKQHLLPLLMGLLRHKSDMVELEACKTLINLQNLLKDDQVMEVVNTLRKLLTVTRIATRFAAIRLINKISIKTPHLVIIVNPELQELINDSNRSISTLAITTLLKIMGSGTIDVNSEGGESIDRLITTMSSMMDDIAEDFKLVIIDAIENLALKFPAKHKKLVAFLEKQLHDDDTLVVKSAIIDALFDLIKFLPDDNAKQHILMILCEFIEDCEFTELSVRILHVLGDEGPKASNPSFYIRHIYNRLVLENSIVRSSAVISLSKFACVCGGDVAANVKILLSRCLNDTDDEVRDRAALSLKFISTNHTELVISDSRYDLQSLEHKLTLYLRDGKFTEKFDASQVPLLSGEELRSLEYTRKIQKLESVAEADAGVEPQNTTPGSNNGASLKNDDDLHANALLKQQAYAQELEAVPEFADYGVLSKSSAKPVYLTERENEFVVAVVMHFFVESQKLVLQYDITNTLPRSTLQDISVIVQPDNEMYVEDFIIPLTELKPDQTGTVYVSFSTPSIDDEDLLVAFGNTVAFTNKDIIDDEGNVDPNEDGWSDEYQIDDLYVSIGDFINPLYNSNFSALYDQLPEGQSAVVAIEVESLDAAVQKLVLSLNGMALDGSEFVPSDASSHVLKLLGKDVWGGKVGFMIRLAKSQGKVMAKIEARCETEQLNAMVSAIVL